MSRAIDFCRRVGAEPLEWPGRGRRASGVILRGRAQALGVPGSPVCCRRRFSRFTLLINSHKTCDSRPIVAGS